MPKGKLPSGEDCAVCGGLGCMHCLPEPPTEEEKLVRAALDALATARVQFRGLALKRVLDECFKDFEKAATAAGIVRKEPAPPMPEKLELIAREISQFLRKFESDKKINIDDSPTGTGLHRYYVAQATSTARGVRVQYVVYQGSTHLTKEEAQTYLAWLRAGNVGTHYQALKALEGGK